MSVFLRKSNSSLSILLATALLFSSLSLAAFPVSAHPAADPSDPQEPALANPIFLPFVSKSVYENLSISHLEVSQAVQNLSDPVGLVANRTTVVRLYARTNTTAAVNNLYASLAAYHNGVLIGGPIIQGPKSAYPLTDSLDSLRASAVKSFNFTLPSSWVAAGNITLIADVDVYNVIPESDEFNAVSQLAAFTTVPALNVVAVPIRYYDYSKSKIYPPQSPSYIQSYLQEALYRMYPVPQVNINVSSEISFSGDLGNYDEDWYDLLDIIETIRSSSELPSSTVFFGVIPLIYDSTKQTWFPMDGGVVGLGYVGVRSSIAVTKDTVYYYLPGYRVTWSLPGDDFAAHEIGHNFGMDHTPCGVSSPYQYPYAGGTIGQYGFKVSQLPSEVVVDKTVTDIMGYCDNQWVSDFTYRRWFDDQRSTLSAIAAPPQDSLYIRARIEADGSASLKPVYGFTASPSDLPQNSDYSIQFLDEQGKLVVEYPVGLLRAEETGLSLQSIHALLPRPESHYSSIRLVNNSAVLATRSLPEAALKISAAASLSLQGDDLLLSWPASETPALVRYSSDDGLTWVAVGVDLTTHEYRTAASDLPGKPLLFQVILGDGATTYELNWTP